MLRGQCSAQISWCTASIASVYHIEYLRGTYFSLASLSRAFPKRRGSANGDLINSGMDRGVLPNFTRRGRRTHSNSEKPNSGYSPVGREAQQRIVSRVPSNAGNKFPARLRVLARLSSGDELRRRWMKLRFCGMFQVWMRMI